MKTFSALLRLQLLSRWADLKPANLKRNLRENKKKTLAKLIGYSVLLLYLGAFLFYVENAVLSALIQIGMEELLLDLAVMGAMISTLILSSFFVMSTLYFSRDAMFMASLPVSPRWLLAAKLTDTWLSELAGSALFLLPAGLLYGIRTAQSPGFFLRLLLVLLGAPVLPVILVALLSTMLIRLSALWKRRETMATIAGVAFLALYMFFCMRMGSMMPDASEEFLTDFLAHNSARIALLTRAFPPAAWAANGLCGDPGQLLLFLLSCCGAVILAVGVLGLVYQKLSLLQSETSAAPGKRRERAASLRAGSPFFACFRLECKRLLRTPAYATNSLPTVLLPVMMVIVMFSSLKNHLDGNESLQPLLDSLNGGVIVAILAVLIAMMAGINPALSTAVTREGAGHNAMASLPLPARTIVRAKMAMGYSLSALGCLLAGFTLVIIMPALALHAGLAVILCLLYTYLCCALSLICDIRNPKLDWLTETEAIKQKSGSLVGLLISWGLLIALGAFGFVLLQLGLEMLPFCSLLITMLLLFSLLARGMLLRTADAKYCQG